MSESGLESLTIPRRRRINSLAVIKNQLLDQLNYGLAKLRRSPLISSKGSSSLADADDLLASPVLDTTNLVPPTESLNRTLVRFTIDPVRREQLIDKEIENLKKEETYLSGCLADIDALVNQMAKVEAELAEKEKKELETRTEDFNNLQEEVMTKIGQLTATKEKIDEHLAITTRLRDCLKRQLNESCKRRSLLKDNLFAHIKEIEKLNRKLAKESDQYQRDVAYMEETFKNVRLGEKTLVEDYKAKERLITKELEERMVIRKSLEESKLIEKRSEEVGLIVDEKIDEEDENQVEETEDEEEDEEEVIIDVIGDEELTEDEEKVTGNDQEEVEGEEIGEDLIQVEIHRSEVESSANESAGESAAESGKESEKASIKDEEEEVF